MEKGVVGKQPIPQIASRIMSQHGEKIQTKTETSRVVYPPSEMRWTEHVGEAVSINCELGPACEAMTPGSQTPFTISGLRVGSSKRLPQLMQ